MSSENTNKGKTAYLIILTIVTVCCIIAGALWHCGGWFNHGLRLGGINVFGSADLGEMMNVEENIGAFSSVDIDLGIGDLEIREGSDYTLSYDYPENIAPEYEIKGGTLSVNEKTHGINVNASYDCKMVITVPSGTKLDDLDVKCSLGDIKIFGISSSMLTVDESLGAITINNAEYDTMKVSNSLGDVDVSGVKADSIKGNLSMGSLHMDDVNIKDVDCENNMGDIKFSGECKYLNLDVDMGDIKVDTHSDWEGTLKTDMGDVSLNGKKMGNRVNNRR